MSYKIADMEKSHAKEATFLPVDVFVHVSSSGLLLGFS